jgi:SAM-dependent methyltransferase
VLAGRPKETEIPMAFTDIVTRDDRVAAAQVRQVLNAGSGTRSARQLHPAFAPEAWREVRVDIDPESEPDVVASIADMGTVFPEAVFDAVWCSHVLEHLFAHEVPFAASEFRRVLRPDGFALITSPDIETVAGMILEGGLDQVAYMSPSGPITAHDMLFGHSASLARGRWAMAHNTGFTCASLGDILIAAGFAAVVAKRQRFDLWAVALMPDADQDAILAGLRAAGLDMNEAA